MHLVLLDAAGHPDCVSYGGRESPGGISLGRCSPAQAYRDAATVCGSGNGRAWSGPSTSGSGVERAMRRSRCRTGEVSPVRHAIAVSIAGWCCRSGSFRNPDQATSASAAGIIVTPSPACTSASVVVVESVSRSWSSSPPFARHVARSWVSRPGADARDGAIRGSLVSSERSARSSAARG